MKSSIIESVTDHNNLKRTILYSDNKNVSYPYGNDVFESKFRAVYYFLHGENNCESFRNELKQFEI